MIDKDPTVGVEDDFTVRTMDIITTKDGDSMLVMLGINRINVPLQNFSFDLTIGNKHGEDVRENYQVVMSEEDVGALEPYSAVPILMNLSEEEEELLRSLDENSLQVIIEDFNADGLE